MNNEHFLIHKDDYIKHINDKVFLYSLVKQLIHMVSMLSPNRKDKALSAMAACYNDLVEKNFRSWGIPAAYLVLENEVLLSDLMENEVINPEDAGYFPCDCEGCCGGCPCCCEEESTGETKNSKTDAEFEDAMAALSNFIHSILGEDVTVHVVME